MRDFCPITRVDHLEFYVGNAKQAAVFYTDDVVLGGGWIR